MKPTVYVIAGPNGAGKTTFAMQYLPSLGNCRMFLNADLIAAALSPHAPEKEGARAGRFLLTRVRELVQVRESFALETTLAGKSYARLFLQMKAQGYRVVIFFFGCPLLIWPLHGWPIEFGNAAMMFPSRTFAAGSRPDERTLASSMSPLPMNGGS